MSKILVGYIINGRAGGIDRYLLNFLNVMHDSDVQVDFLTTKVDKSLKLELQDYGSRLYEIPSLRHPLKQYQKMCKIFNYTTYDIAYFNISTTLNGIGVFSAKHFAVPKRILHSHSSGVDCSNALKRNLLCLLNKIGRIFLYKAGTDYFACSIQAGKWLFPNKIVDSAHFSIIPNVIDTKKFAFNSEMRRDYRKKLNLNHHFVLGHVGNFCYQKNQSYLISVFCEVAKKNSNAMLLLVGDGPDMEKIKRQCTRMNLTEKVIFLGRRCDVAELLQAMDVLLLPSHFEGFPIVAVEAQASGLPCFLSDSISREVDITDLVQRLSIKEAPAVWAKSINSTSCNLNRAAYASKVSEAGYDIKTTAKELENFFLTH